MSSVPTVCSVSTSGGMEERLRSVEQTVSTLRHGSPVEDALHQIRILAPHVLLSAVELLVEQAALVAHKDATFYSKALRACREINSIHDLCSLCLKLFGSSDDKKISAALTDYTQREKC